MFMKVPSGIKLGKSASTLEDRVRIERLLNWRNGLKNKMQSSRDKYKLLKKIIILFTNIVRGVTGEEML